MTQSTTIWAEPLAISGWGVTSVLGIGKDAFAEGLADSRDGRSDPADLFEEPLPDGDAFVIRDLDVKEHLGKKGVSFLDRTSALALIACGQALDDTDVTIDDDTRDRVGVVLGTTSGSMRATSDYSRVTFVEERPYLVNPLIFPNAVMNCAAGQAAIRYGLRGVNSTVAGDSVAFVSSLAYARTITALGRADALVVGAAEEYGPQTAWAAEFSRRIDGGGLPAGEGSAAFFVESREAAERAGRTPVALVLAAGTRACAPDSHDTMATFVEEVCANAGIAVGDVDLVSCGESGSPRDAVESQALDAVFGQTRRIRLKEAVGEAASAGNALQLAALLASEKPGTLAVLTSTTRDGVLGVAVVRVGNESA